MPDRSEDFYAGCRAFVRRLAARTFSADEADDITQEVMLRLIRHVSELDLNEPIEPWLATVTRTVGINARRDRREVPTRHDAIDDGLGPVPDQPAHAAELADQLRFLRAAVRRLSDEDAHLLSEHEIAGVPLTDIARAYGVEPNAIRQRLFRARRRLSRHYLALGGPGNRCWPAPLVALTRRLRRRPTRYAVVAVGAAFALLVAGMTGDGDSRLIPLPTPMPHEPPVAAPEVATGPDMPVAVTRAVRHAASVEATSRAQVSWHRVDGPDSDLPPPRRDASLAYDEARHEYVLFGGLGDDGTAKDTLDDTWTSADGVHWTPWNTPPAVQRRAGAAMFYDPRRQQVVLAGGQIGGLAVSNQGRFRDVDQVDRNWAWDGTSWNPLPQSELGLTTLHDSAAVAYDRTAGVAVQFGGRCKCAPTVRQDTRTWVDGQWHDVAPRHLPPARDGAAIAFDPVGRAVMFGGMDASGRPLGDTWVWDGVDWREVRPVHAPSPRQLAAMVTTGQGPVLVGGYDGRHNVSDAWLWRGGDWQLLQVGGAVPAVSGGAVAYNPDRQEVLLFSGDLAPKSRAAAMDIATMNLRLSEQVLMARIAGDPGLRPVPPATVFDSLPPPLPPVRVTDL